MYVYQSTGQYAGTYRSYVNGIGANPLMCGHAGLLHPREHRRDHRLPRP